MLKAAVVFLWLCILIGMVMFFARDTSPEHLDDERKEFE